MLLYSPIECPHTIVIQNVEGRGRRAAWQANERLLLVVGERGVARRILEEARVSLDLLGIQNANIVRVVLDGEL